MVGGSLRPICFAVLRFITSSNFVVAPPYMRWGNYGKHPDPVFLLPLFHSMAAVGPGVFLLTHSLLLGPWIDPFSRQVVPWISFAYTTPEIAAIDGLRKASISSGVRVGNTCVCSAVEVRGA